jgi:hypothetical protein
MVFNSINATLPDGQAATIFYYNLSYNFTNWDGYIYNNDTIIVNYTVNFIGGGDWILPAIIGGWDPQYQKTIQTQMITSHAVPLFDIELGVVTKKIKPGQDVTAILKMKNVGGPEAQVDVFVTNSIKTMSGELVNEKSETFAVIAGKEKELTIQTPSNLKPGMYTFESFASYTQREAMTTDTFEVVAEEKPANNYLIYLVVASVTILGVVFMLTRRKK